MSPHTSIMPTIINGQTNQNHQPPPHMNQGPDQDAGCETAEEDCAIAWSGLAAAIPQTKRNVESFCHILTLHDYGSSHHTQQAVGLLHRFRLGAAVCQEVIEFLFVFRRAQVIEEIV
jgi:hypothetical protein